MMNPLKILISGGGTGGHIFPALSIADEIRRRYPKAEILFVGARGRMEMERVPAAGYKIVGLPVSGIQRRITLKNFKVVADLIRSLLMARKLVREFQPSLAIGVGGYASGPVLRSAARKGIPTLLQEQNSYAGVTNKLLAAKASVICVAYSGMEKYFPEDKLVLTGNPVRPIKISEELRADALTHFNLQSEKPVVLIVGGSLGARTLNNAMAAHVSLLLDAGIQVVWQTGKYYYDEMSVRVDTSHPLLHVLPFIARMDLAYNVADVMISRAGAISISEICLTGTASILVPSPNVAEDHQTKNALALVKENAAVLISDKEAGEKLVTAALELLADKERCASLRKNSLRLAQPDATAQIVDEVEKIVERSSKR